MGTDAVWLAVASSRAPSPISPFAAFLRGIGLEGTERSQPLLLPPDVATAAVFVRSGDRRQIILAALPPSLDESARADDGENDGDGDDDSSVAIIMFSENPRFPGIALSFAFACCHSTPNREKKTKDSNHSLLTG